MEESKKVTPRAVLHCFETDLNPHEIAVGGHKDISISIKQKTCHLTLWCHDIIYHEPPKTMKNKGVGHLKIRLFTIKTSKNDETCRFSPPQIRKNYGEPPSGTVG